MAANIFGGVELPDWMRGLGAQNQKVAGEFGETLGTGLGALALMASGEKGDPDPMTGQAQPLSFGAAYQRARMNQVDPMWGLKAQQMKINAQDAAFKMQAQSLALQDASEERKARLEDLPTVREWMKQPDTEAKWKQLPDVGSQWARGTVDAQVKQHDAKELKEQQLENQRQAVQNKIDIATLQQEGIAAKVKAETESREKVAGIQAQARLDAAQAAAKSKSNELDRREAMLHYAKLPAAQHAQAQKILADQRRLTSEIDKVIAATDIKPEDKPKQIAEIQAKIDALDSKWNSNIVTPTDGASTPATPLTAPGNAWNGITAEDLSKAGFGGAAPAGQAPAASSAASDGTAGAPPGMLTPAVRSVPGNPKPAPPKAASGKFRYDLTSGKIVPITE